jgi:hypothetical protein
MTEARGTDDQIVVLRTYLNQVEAELDASVLEANGIPARVSADTAGGALPSMSVMFPIRLLVRTTDAQLAAELLDTSVDEEPRNPENTEKP